MLLCHTVHTVPAVLNYSKKEEIIIMNHPTLITIVFLATIAHALDLSPINLSSDMALRPLIRRHLSVACFKIMDAWDKLWPYQLNSKERHSYSTPSQKLLTSLGDLSYKFVDLASSIVDTVAYNYTIHYPIAADPSSGYPHLDCRETTYHCEPLGEDTSALLADDLYKYLNALHRINTQHTEFASQALEIWKDWHGNFRPISNNENETTLMGQSNRFYEDISDRIKNLASLADKITTKLENFLDQASSNCSSLGPPKECSST